MGRQTQPSGREDPLDVHDCSGAHQTQKALSGLEGCARNQRITRGIGKFHVSIKVWKTTRSGDTATTQLGKTSRTKNLIIESKGPISIWMAALIPRTTGSAFSMPA